MQPEGVRFLSSVWFSTAKNQDSSLHGRMCSRANELLNYILCSSFDTKHPFTDHATERNPFEVELTTKASKRPSEKSSEMTSKRTAKSTSNPTMECSIGCISRSYQLKQNHQNVYRDRLRFHSMLFIFSSLLLVAVDASSPPKIMPFHFNPQQVQEGQKALASKWMSLV